MKLWPDQVPDIPKGNETHVVIFRAQAYEENLGNKRVRAQKHYCSMSQTKTRKTKRKLNIPIIDLIVIAARLACPRSVDKRTDARVAPGSS